MVAPRGSSTMAPATLDTVAVEMKAAFEEAQQANMDVAGAGIDPAKPTDALSAADTASNGGASSLPDVSDVGSLADSAAAALSEVGATDANMVMMSCNKCLRMKPAPAGTQVMERADGSTEEKWFCCKECNTKRSTLSRIFGKWPIDAFNALPKEKQLAFWQADFLQFTQFSPSGERNLCNYSVLAT